MPHCPFPQDSTSTLNGQQWRHLPQSVWRWSCTVQQPDALNPELFEEIETYATKITTDEGRTRNSVSFDRASLALSAKYTERLFVYKPGKPVYRPWNEVDACRQFSFAEDFADGRVNMHSISLCTGGRRRSCSIRRALLRLHSSGRYNRPAWAHFQVLCYSLLMSIAEDWLSGTTTCTSTLNMRKKGTEVPSIDRRQRWWQRNID